jgi:hypothetical protein
MSISNEELLVELARFFMDDFHDDPAGAGEWSASGLYDVDEFYSSVAKIIERDNGDI